MPYSGGAQAKLDPSMGLPRQGRISFSSCYVSVSLSAGSSPPAGVGGGASGEVLPHVQVRRADRPCGGRDVWRALVCFGPPQRVVFHARESIHSFTHRKGNNVPLARIRLHELSIRVTSHRDLMHYFPFYGIETSDLMFHEREPLLVAITLRSSLR